MNISQALHLEDFQGWAFDPESLQGRLPKLTKRMKKICATLMKDSSILDLVENLDNFTGKHPKCCLYYDLIRHFVLGNYFCIVDCGSSFYSKFAITY